MCPRCESLNTIGGRFIDWDYPIIVNRIVQRVTKRFEVWKCSDCKTRWWKDAL